MTSDFRRRRLIQLLAIPLLLYALMPATRFRGDGMAYADLLRDGSPLLLNPNHLLYGPLAWAAYRPLDALWPGVDPMRVLQVMAFAQAVACLWLFHRLLGLYRVPAAAAAGFTLCLAGSAGFWLQAISPETFLLSMVLEILCFSRAARFLDRPCRGEAIRLGLTLGLAVLGTQVDLLAAPAVALILWRGGGKRRWSHLWYGAACAAAVVLGGFLGAWAIARPDRPLEWLAGRAATPVFLSWSLPQVAGDVRNLAINLVPQLSRVIALARGDLAGLNLLHGALAAGVAVLAALLVARAGRGLFLLQGSHRTLVLAMGLYLAGLSLFFTVWANQLPEFWANHWVVIWMLLALGARESAPRVPRTGVAAIALGLLLVALGAIFVGAPTRFSEEGRLARLLDETVPGSDLLLVVWNENLAAGRAAGQAGDETARARARSTFAVNLGTYLNRPVASAGCWTDERETRCYESHPDGLLHAAVNEAIDSGRGAWIFQASTSIPASGLEDPGGIARLVESAGTAEAWRAEAGDSFHDARLLSLGRQAP